MRHEFLLCIYLFVLLAEIILLIRAWRSAKISSWIQIYILEISSSAAALAVMRYYNDHPGYLLSTMGHVLWSMGAAGVFFIMFLLTVIIHILRIKRNKWKEGR